jgi:glycosyltransferase involved in cell wall biosynthesis
MRLSSHPKYSSGGSERQMDLIGQYLIKKNVDVHFFINKTTKTQKEIEEINGIKVHTIGKPRDFKASKDKKTLSNIINATDSSLFYKHLFKFNFDIYHMMGADFITGVWAFFSRVIKKKKFVFTAASILDCEKNGFGWSKTTNQVYKYGVQHADQIVVLADYMKKEMDKNFNIYSTVIKSGHPIPNGDFKKDKPPIILWISRLNKLKCPDLFIKIFEELKDLNAKFVLIGSGSYMKNELIKFSKKHSNFTYIPGVKQYIDNAYYAKASLLINTSSVEGFPTAFIQAWMYKTPVISLNIDPDDVISYYNLGFHAKGNFQNLIDTIKDLIENSSKTKDIGKNCRDYAIANHDIEQTSKQYYSLYKKLLH